MRSVLTMFPSALKQPPQLKSGMASLIGQSQQKPSDLGKVLQKVLNTLNQLPEPGVFSPTAGSQWSMNPRVEVRTAAHHHSS